ncbi:MAG: hypothetical protein AB7F89_21275 [Pirellulaceae bacterium]
MITVKQKIQFQRGSQGRRRITDSPPATEAVEPGRIPRVSRLIALAIRFDRMIRDGVVADQSELARLAHVTQPRMTQIMNLLNLAPDIQEALLFLPRVEQGKDPVTERELRAVVAEVDWGRQRRMLAPTMREASFAYPTVTSLVHVG